MRPFDRGSQSALAARGSASRWMLLALVAVLSGSGVVVVVAVNAMGALQFREAVAAALDDAHLWGPRTELLRRAQRYERGRPEADAERAVADGDIHLLAVVGVVSGIPGVSDPPFDVLARSHALEYLYGGCEVRSPEEERFRTAAYDYAMRYNRIVVKAVR